MRARREAPNPPDVLAPGRYHRAMEIRPVTTEAEWQLSRSIRERVFIVGQDCAPEEEWDAHDPDGALADAHHVLGTEEGPDGEVAVATARWREVEWQGHPAAKLERFAVLSEYRGGGRGRALVRHLLAEGREAGFSTFLLHAQAHLEAFYADFGFERVGEVFEEAGIPHVKMVLREGRVL